MPGSDARELASVLDSLELDALARLLDERDAPSDPAWRDAYDAAEALSDPHRVLRSLAALTGEETDALQRRAAGAALDADLAEALRRHGLTGPTGDVLSTVLELLATSPAPRPAPPTLGAPESDAAVAERAFTTLASLADVLQIAAETPLAQIGSGALGAADRKRLVDSGAVIEPADADALVRIADLAGLIAPIDRTWHLTATGEAWLDLSTIERWHAVADAIVNHLPSALAPDALLTPPSQWGDAYPLDPQWPHVAAVHTDTVIRWGLAARDGRLVPWADTAQGTGALLTLFPSEVDRVYLQNDLTAISPGPLAPRLDRRLRSMARRESRAQASTYRFTADTIGAAFAGGETAPSLREFLSALSLTGVPQPLGYEIERASQRYGQLRVGPRDDGRSQITGDGEALRAAAVDQALRPLGLSYQEETLVSRAGVDTVFWMLVDARYPVLAVDAAGSPLTVRRAPLAPARPAKDPVATYAPLIDRLRAASASGDDAAWLTRELDRAVRGRAVVTVVVQLPDGSERSFTLEAAGLGGGRLRGRDRAADVERTLPISSIVRIENVDQG